MLTRQPLLFPNGKSRTKQRGVVLFIALIAMVAMTLAGIALTRSVDTSNVIAGNLAFSQSTVLSSDSGIEAAITWLEANNVPAGLDNNIAGNGYIAVRTDPLPGQSWDNYWTTVLQPAGQVLTLAPDPTGNTTSYIIQRLCNAQGSANLAATACSVSPSTNATGADNKDVDANSFAVSNVYYRITARTAGPRNTVSYTQAIVRMSIQ